MMKFSRPRFPPVVEQIAKLLNIDPRDIIRVGIDVPYDSPPQTHIEMVADLEMLKLEWPISNEAKIHIEIRPRQ